MNRIQHGHHYGDTVSSSQLKLTMKAEVANLNRLVHTTRTRFPLTFIYHSHDTSPPTHLQLERFAPTHSLRSLTMASKLRDFVQQRDGALSPQNGQRSNPSRQAIAANARVRIGQPLTQHNQKTPAQSAIPSRGVGNAQNTSATIQPALHHRPSLQRQKNDPYDTDAESIDTTINQSVVQPENELQGQHHNEAPPGIPGCGEGERIDEFSDDFEGDEFDQYEFTEEEVMFLQQQGLSHLSRREAVEFLQRARPHNFRTIDGDSYPTTTDGEVSEIVGPVVEDVASDPLSPSPRRPEMESHPVSRSFQPRTVAEIPHKIVPNQPSIFQHSANLRDQQRLSSQHTKQHKQDHQGKTLPLISNQLPYTRTSRNNDYVPTANQYIHQHVIATNDRPQQSKSHPIQAVNTKIPSKRPAASRTQVVPIIQQPLSPIDGTAPFTLTDYDQGTLQAMSYDQLKNESFDTNPGIDDAVLPDDIAQKSLTERLEFVQKNLEADHQSTFFRSLPTSEWEDAGDWFLDQFSSIVRRTKEARQKKRKLAQEFEAEVEKRHNHVFKKQQQVEEAMSKMKAQGEGLVPKSPRASKSPKPKKRVKDER